MSLKIELTALLMVFAGAGGFLAVEKPLADPAPLERTDTFTKADFEAFDRNFRHGREVCPVGIEKDRLCFQTSPLEEELVKGQVLAANVPLLSAEFSIIVATPAKSEEQKLLRFGKSLALINAESRTVEDVMHLGADSFDLAVQPRGNSTDVATIENRDREA